MRPLLEGGHLPVAQLVQDPPGILVAEVVQSGSLPFPERSKRGGGELGRERERLEAREDAVPAEHGHEPGQAGGRQAPPACDRGRETQCGEIDEAPPVGRLQLVLVTFEPRCTVEPLLQIALHVAPGSQHCRGLVGRHAQLCRPDPVRLETDPEGQAGLVDLRRRRRRDRRRPPEHLALVGEHQTAVLHPTRVAALLLERVLDLEQVGEVAPGLEANPEVDRLLVVVEDRQLLVEAVATARWRMTESFASM